MPKDFAMKVYPLKLGPIPIEMQATPIISSNLGEISMGMQATPILPIKINETSMGMQATQIIPIILWYWTLALGGGGAGEPDIHK